MRIEYHALGSVKSPVKAPLRPEEMRGLESRLVLEPRFEAALSAITPGRHAVVVYHLHQAKPWHDQQMSEVFVRPLASRPNPIGVTLVQVLRVEGSTATVVGLDAIDGSPILDIKPYEPKWDAPPVHPAERKP